MTTLNPYIGFAGKCGEAMEFYKQCLGGGELNILTVAGSPIANQCPEAMQGQAMHAMLKKDNLVLMGTDMVSPEGYHFGNNIAISVSCSSESEIRSFFDAFGAGGSVIDALGVKFWGAWFGVVKDKYGIAWMFNFDPNAK